MTDKHPIRNGIIASVTAGIILAILGQVWPPASRLLTSLWALLSANVTVPVWALALVALTFLALIRIMLRLRRTDLPTPAPTSQDVAASTTGARSAPIAHARPAPIAATPPADPLSDLEQQVLGRMVKADGAPVPQDTIKRSLGMSNLRIQAAVDHLEALDLVEVLQEDVDGDIVVFLTSKGRRYLVKTGLA